MKPRKKWEPVYRFGGNPASSYLPPPLGQANGYRAPKAKKKKK